MKRRLFKMKIKEEVVFSKELLDKYEKEHDENKF